VIEAGHGERVQADVMVIPAGAQEPELVGDPHVEPEAEDVAVEADGAVEVGHMQVHMADRGAGIDRGHGRSLAATHTPGLGVNP
jgi:hypothetical protein